MVEYRPLISILVPSYNHQNYIAETIESIWAQSYKEIEIIVVDDCSPDDSWLLIQELAERSACPMKIFQNTVNMGPAATMNVALAQAAGELVTFVASDDVFSLQRFDGALKLFARSSVLQVVYGNGRTFGEGGYGELIHKRKAVELLAKAPQEIARYLYTNTSPLFIQAAVFKREALENIGGFDANLLADDWLLNSRLFSSFSNKEQYAYIPDEVVYYRQHGENIHKNYDRHEKLKIEFIANNTPDELKNEGFSNIYFWAAKQRMKQGDLQIAWQYYSESQKYFFRYKRCNFILSWFKRKFHDFFCRQKLGS